MDKTQRIEELKRELEALEAAPEESPQANLNYYTLRDCQEALDTIKICTKQIDLEKQAIADIQRAFQLINTTSWRAMKAIEKEAIEQ